MKFVSILIKRTRLNGGSINYFAMPKNIGVGNQPKWWLNVKKGV